MAPSLDDLHVRVEKTVHLLTGRCQGSGFVTKERAARVDGFDKAFTQAGKNTDGKLDRDEFKAAWAIYTSKPQGFDEIQEATIPALSSSDRFQANCAITLDGCLWPIRDVSRPSQNDPFLPVAIFWSNDGSASLNGRSLASR